MPSRCSFRKSDGQRPRISARGMRRLASPSEIRPRSFFLAERARMCDESFHCGSSLHGGVEHFAAHRLAVMRRSSSNTLKITVT